MPWWAAPHAGAATRRSVLASAAVLLGAAKPASPAKFQLTSPNGRIRVTLTAPASGPVTYAVSYDGQSLITPSVVGLDVTGPVFDRAPQTVTVARRTLDEPFVLPAGKTRLARNHASQLTITRMPGAGGPAHELVWRAYDDGVAFRCRIAGSPDSGMVIRGEVTQFGLPANATCWGADLKTFQTAHEAQFHATPAAALDPHSLFDAPLVCQLPATGVTFALAEADVADYAACYFVPRADGPGVQIRLSPRLDDPSIAVRVPPGQDAVSPWRVIMIADHPASLIDSTLIAALNPPPAFADVSWIKPGKAAWDWWSGFTTAARGGMTDATLGALLGFAASSGLQYLLIDAGWYVTYPGTGEPGRADLTRPIPAIDLPALVATARQRGIGIVLWMHWQHLAAQFQPALDFCAATGISGIKVDFFNRDDQEMVALVHRLLAEAASRRLIVDLHGMYHPTGLSRTYPNLLTQEGVLGAEYNKWGRLVSATHNVTLPFTRMLLGPMDYTPGGFRNTTPAAFTPREVDPMVQTTRGQALAMYVVFESPFSCIADSPDAYAGQPGFAFIAAIPTTWDETRGLAGQIGQYVIVARRSGPDWYVGAMTNEQGRIVQLPLSFLPPGEWLATLYQDGDTPTGLHILQDLPVRAADRLAIRLAASGGAALRLRKLHTRGS